MLTLHKQSRLHSLLHPRISITNGPMILMTGTTRTMMTGILRTRMSGPKLQTTMMVAIRLSGETEGTVISVAEGSHAAPSMVTVVAAEVAMIGRTRMTDSKVATIATTMVRVVPSTRTATTRTDKVATEVDEVVAWIGRGLTAAAWTEEVQEVAHEETREDAVAADSEEANQAKGYRPVVRGLSSSASEHTRHDRLNSQLPQHFG